MTYKVLQVPSVVYLDHGFTALIDDLERPVGHILLDIRIVVCPPDQSFRVENGVVRVLGCLVLGRISDKSFVLCESYP